MTDPLTYLDEVDALWRDEQNRPGGAIAQHEVLTLSKALRAVLARRPQPTDPIDLDLVARERALGYNRALADVRQAIQAALAVNDEGGTT